MNRNKKGRLHIRKRSNRALKALIKKSNKQLDKKRTKKRDLERQVRASKKLRNRQKKSCDVEII
jgi:hypothetical protein